MLKLVRINPCFSFALFLFIVFATLVCSAQEFAITHFPLKSIELRDPKAISISSEGLIYIADTGHHRVICVDSTGKLVTETGGFGTAHGQFRWPQDIKANQAGSVWVLDYGNRRLEKFSRTLEYQGTFEANDSEDSFHEPEKFALSPQGDLFVYDRDGNRILSYDPLFKLRSILGGKQKSSFVADVVSMDYSLGRGLFWIEREKNELFFSDNILSSINRTTLVPNEMSPCFILADSNLIFSSDNALKIKSSLNSPEIKEVFSSDALTQAGIQNITALAYDSRFGLLILDGFQGSLYRILLNRN